MKTSGAETLSISANIFVGQTEAPILIRPFINNMTKSELMAVMTGGFATAAGSVLALYVLWLQTIPGIAGHLLAASIMSAPAALVIAKIIYPETEQPDTTGNIQIEIKKQAENAMDALGQGATDGLKLAANVGAMLIAFVSIITMINYSLVYLFSVKSGNLTRETWNGNADQALRPSLDQIQDSFISSRLPPEHRDKPIVICLCFGGDISTGSRQDVSSYEQRYTRDNIAFEEWNGDKLSELIQQHLFKEELLPSASQALLRKSLALLDDPESSTKHFFILAHKVLEVANSAESVEYAMATRFQADKDLVIIKNVRGSSLDPSSDQKKLQTAKMGIDATRSTSKRPEGFEMAKIPKIDKINLKKYFK